MKGFSSLIDTTKIYRMLEGVNKFINLHSRAARTYLNMLGRRILHVITRKKPYAVEDDVKSSVEMHSPGTDQRCSLASFKKTVHSQYGEDGIIEKIFLVIGESNKQCVEFGAGDGKAMSNTRNLLSNKGWSGVAIEADKNLYVQLVTNYQDNQRVICINKVVNFEGQDTLDNMLRATPMKESFDLLSIDVDGNDYHMWDSIKAYSPRVVVVEFNQTIPPDIEFVQPRNLNVNQGTSLLSLVILGKAKGYELIAATDLNAFFVKKEYFNLFGIHDNSIRSIRLDSDYETHLFQLYDGTLVLAGNKRLLWHGRCIDQNKIQVLPKILRKYPDKLSPVMRSCAKHGWSGIIVYISSLLHKAAIRFLRKKGN